MRHWCYKFNSIIGITLPHGYSYLSSYTGVSSPWVMCITLYSGFNHVPSLSTLMTRNMRHGELTRADWVSVSFVHKRRNVWLSWVVSNLISQPIKQRYSCVEFTQNSPRHYRSSSDECCPDKRPRQRCTTECSLIASPDVTNLAFVHVIVESIPWDTRGSARLGSYSREQ